jgi:periplasmic protein TonB
MTREDWLRREDRRRSALSALASLVLLGLVAVAALALGPGLGALPTLRADTVAVRLELDSPQAAQPAGQASIPDPPPASDTQSASVAPRSLPEAATAPVAQAASPAAQPRPEAPAQGSPSEEGRVSQAEGIQAASPAAEASPLAAPGPGPAPSQGPASSKDVGGSGGMAAVDAGAPAGGSREAASGSPGAYGSEADPSAALSRRLGAFIEENKVYPEAARRRGTRGTVYLSLSVGSGGELIAIKSVKSSGSKLLDEAALKLLRLAFPLKEPPGRRLDLVLAIRYDLKS